MEGLLSIGSVVLLKDSNYRVMITGLMQMEVRDGKKIAWDYCGCLFPYGMQDSKQYMLFNEEHIVRVFALGYQDEEQLKFIDNMNAARKKLKEQLQEEKQKQSEE